MEKSRCYTRHIGWDSSNHREMDLQLFRTHISNIGPLFRTSTAKPTAFTAGCASASHSVSFRGTTASVLGAGLRLRPTREVASPLPRHGGPQGSLWLVHRRRWVMVAWGNQRENDGRWNIPGPILGRPGADEASSSPGALHILNAGRTRFLVPPGPRSQHVFSGDPM